MVTFWHRYFIMAAVSKSVFKSIKSTDKPESELKNPFKHPNKEVSQASFITSTRTEVSTLPTFRHHYDPTSLETTDASLLSTLTEAITPTTVPDLKSNNDLSEADPENNVEATKPPSKPSSKAPSKVSSKPSSKASSPLSSQASSKPPSKVTSKAPSQVSSGQPARVQASTSNEKTEKIAASATTNVSEKKKPFLSNMQPILIPVPIKSKSKKRIPTEKTLTNSESKCATKGSTRPPSIVSTSGNKSIKSVPEESIISSALGLSSTGDTNISRNRDPSAMPLVSVKCPARRVNAHARDVNENPGFIIGPPVQYQARQKLHPVEYQAEQSRQPEHPIEYNANKLHQPEHPIEYHANKLRQPERPIEYQANKLRQPERPIEYHANKLRQPERPIEYHANKVRKLEGTARQTIPPVESQGLPSFEELVHPTEHPRLDRTQNKKKRRDKYEKPLLLNSSKQDESRNWSVAPYIESKTARMIPSSKESSKSLHSDIEAILKILDNSTNNAAANAAAKIISEFYGIPPEFASTPKPKSNHPSKQDRKLIPETVGGIYLPLQYNTMEDMKNFQNMKSPSPCTNSFKQDSDMHSEYDRNEHKLRREVEIKPDKLVSELEVDREHNYKVDNSLLLDNKDTTQTIENRETRQTDPQRLKTSSITSRTSGKQTPHSNQQSEFLETCQSRFSNETDQSLEILDKTKTQDNTKMKFAPTESLLKYDDTESLTGDSLRTPVQENETKETIVPQVRKVCNDNANLKPPPRPVPPLTRSRIKAMPEVRPKKIPFNEGLVEFPERVSPTRSPRSSLIAHTKLNRTEVDYYTGDPKTMNEREARRRSVKYSQRELPSQPPPGSVSSGDAPPIPPRICKKNSNRSKPYAPIYYVSKGKSKLYSGNKNDSKVTFSPSTAPSPFPESPRNSHSGVQEPKDCDHQHNFIIAHSHSKSHNSRIRGKDSQGAIKSSKLIRVPRSSEDPCYIGRGSIFWNKENPEPVKWLPVTVISTRKIKNVVISDLDEASPLPSFRYPGLVEEVHIDGDITQENFLYLLHQLYELKTLEIHISSLHSLQLDQFTIGAIELPNLKSLEISTAAFIESDALQYNLSRIIANLIFILGLIFPSLSYLGVAFPFVPDLELNIMTAIWRCILNHRETLKLLNIECPFVQPQQFGKVGSTEFWRRFLKTQENLQYIQFWCEGPVYYKFPYDIIKKNYYLLQTLSMNVDIQSYPDRQNKVPIDCSIFKGMPYLKTIALKGYLVEHQNPKDLLRPDLINIQGLAPRMETIKIMNLNIDQADVSKLVLDNNPNLKILYLDNIGKHGTMGLTLETLVSLLQRPCGSIQKIEAFESINRKSLEQGMQSPKEPHHIDKGYRLITKILLKKESRPSFRAYRTSNNDFEIYYEDEEKDNHVGKDEWVEQELINKSSVNGPGTKRIVSSLMKPGIGRTGANIPITESNNGRVSISSDDSRKLKYKNRSVKKLYSNNEIVLRDTSSRRPIAASSASRRKNKNIRLMN
ncbi:unnamed protein product [Allacma fusca]|uniref:Uncharacterized protein n=1 Tax=Allacma fusca TaxID=39272 RepID=A0A8J2PKP2_9HEXA|nr:unnamed protein product [Allacma fusca]